MRRFLSAVFVFAKGHKIISGIGAILIILAIVIPINAFSTTPNTYTIVKENLVNTVLVNGTYTIASQTQVVSPTNGNVTDVFVANGQEVKKGDKLFHVASSATEDEIRAANAAYLAASSTVQADNATLYSLQSTMFSAWDTYYQLATSGTYQNSDGSPVTDARNLPAFTTAQDNWLAAEADYKNQQAVIAKDSAALSSAKLTYDETQSTTVIAPADGQIINLSVKPGDQVTASTATTIAPSVLVIADFANPVLSAEVDQVNIPRLKKGQKASIIFDALPNQTFSGTVDHIDTAGVKTQGTVNFTVTIVANNLPDSIKPNMTASITVETGRKENVLTIPNEAIISKNGKSYVQLAGRGTTDLTPITVGLQGLTKSEVISGISAGQQVILQQ